MPTAGQYPLFECERIRPFLQHLHIMVGLEDQGLAFLQVMLDELGDFAGVGAVAQTAGPIADHETDRIGGVMGHRKRMNMQITDDERFAGAEFPMYR